MGRSSSHSLDSPPLLPSPPLLTAPTPNETPPVPNAEKTRREKPLSARQEEALAAGPMAPTRRHTPPPPPLLRAASYGSLSGRPRSRRHLPACASSAEDGCAIGRDAEETALRRHRSHGGSRRLSPPDAHTRRAPKPEDTTQPKPQRRESVEEPWRSFHGCRAVLSPGSEGEPELQRRVSGGRATHAPLAGNGASGDGAHAEVGSSAVLTCYPTMPPSVLSQDARRGMRRSLSDFNAHPPPSHAAVNVPFAPLNLLPMTEPPSAHPVKSESPVSRGCVDGRPIDTKAALRLFERGEEDNHNGRIFSPSPLRRPRERQASTNPLVNGGFAESRDHLGGRPSVSTAKDEANNSVEINLPDFSPVFEGQLSTSNSALLNGYAMYCTPDSSTSAPSISLKVPLTQTPRHSRLSAPRQVSEASHVRTVPSPTAAATATATAKAAETATPIVTASITMDVTNTTPPTTGVSTVSSEVTNTTTCPTSSSTSTKTTSSVPSSRLRPSYKAETWFDEADVGLCAAVNIPNATWTLHHTQAKEKDSTQEDKVLKSESAPHTEDEDVVNNGVDEEENEEDEEDGDNEYEEDQEDEEEEDLLLGFYPLGFTAPKKLRLINNIVFYLTKEDIEDDTEENREESTGRNRNPSILQRLASAPRVKRIDTPVDLLAQHTLLTRVPSSVSKCSNGYSILGGETDGDLTLTRLSKQEKDTPPHLIAPKIYCPMSAKFFPDPKKIHKPPANTFGMRRTRRVSVHAANSSPLVSSAKARLGERGGAHDEEEEEEDEDEEMWEWEEVEEEVEEDEEEDWVEEVAAPAKVSVKR